MNKHTQGPWIARAHQSSVHQFRIESDSGAVTVAGVEGEANARLIAAAPELLAAARAALDYFGRLGMGPRELTTLCNQLNAAIGKAEGRS